MFTVKCSNLQQMSNDVTGHYFSRKLIGQKYSSIILREFYSYDISYHEVVDGLRITSIKYTTNLITAIQGHLVLSKLVTSVTSKLERYQFWLSLSRLVLIGKRL